MQGSTPQSLTYFSRALVPAETAPCVYRLRRWLGGGASKQSEAFRGGRGCGASRGGGGRPPGWGRLWARLMETQIGRLLWRCVGKAPQRIMASAGTSVCVKLPLRYPPIAGQFRFSRVSLVF